MCIYIYVDNWFSLTRKATSKFLSIPGVNQHVQLSTGDCRKTWSTCTKVWTALVFCGSTSAIHRFWLFLETIFHMFRDSFPLYPFSGCKPGGRQKQDSDTAETSLLRHLGSWPITFVCLFLLSACLRSCVHFMTCHLENKMHLWE